jgi:predicted nuclease with TOPRIM domain
MQAKKTLCFFSVLIMFSALLCIVDALPDTNVAFSGGGVTINITFPDEAHPAESVWHNVTINSATAATLLNFTAVIKAPITSGWVEIINSQDTFRNPLPMNYNLSLLLPQEANGTLQCFIYVNTSTAQDLSIMFYTTQVREMTYMELLEGYNVLNNTYNQLVSDYVSLNNTYNELQSSYATLNSSYNELTDNYNILNNNYNDLSAKYTILNNNYNELDSMYNSVSSARNSLIGDYNELQSDYNLLNSTFFGVQGNFTALQALYDELNETYDNLVTIRDTLQTDLANSTSALNNDRIMMFIFVTALAALIVFIIYLKRGKEEPYVVIRKETVKMKSDEET